MTKNYFITGNLGLQNLGTGCSSPAMLTGLVIFDFINNVKLVFGSVRIISDGH